MKHFFKKIILFVLPAIALILVFEAACRVIGVPKHSYNNVQAKTQFLLPKIDSTAIVFLGDSRIERSIKTNWVKNGEGGVYNLALPHSNSFDILKYFLKNEIYPKKIVMGFTPHYYRYENHGMEDIELSMKNRIVQSVKYHLRQNSYFHDSRSIEWYLKDMKPYKINHEYDDWGNAEVKENGDYYSERIKPQIKNFSKWNNEFDSIKFKNYKVQLDSLVKCFNGRSKIYGIYMPVCKNLFLYEKEHYDENEIKKYFDSYLDFSEFNPKKHDSIYFYDGSHLTRESAIDFSKKIDKILN